MPPVLAATPDVADPALWIVTPFVCTLTPAVAPMSLCDLNGVADTRDEAIERLHVAWTKWMEIGGAAHCVMEPETTELAAAHAQNQKCKNRRSAIAKSAVSAYK